jgi:hypothetical protein
LLDCRNQQYSKFHHRKLWYRKDLQVLLVLCKLVLLVLALILVAEQVLLLVLISQLELQVLCKLVLQLVLA